MPYEGLCLCGGCKVFVDTEPRFKVRQNTLLAFCKFVNVERRAWEYATARIVLVATVAHMHAQCPRTAKASEQREQSRCIRL